MTKDTKWIRNPEYDKATHDVEFPKFVEVLDPKKKKEMREVFVQLVKDGLLDGLTIHGNE